MDTLSLVVIGLSIGVMGAFVWDAITQQVESRRYKHGWKYNLRQRVMDFES